MIKKITRHHVISAAALGGVAIAAFSLGGASLFDTTDDFVLFAQTEAKLEQSVQVSSGNIGSNNNVTVDKESLITGDLFADSITLDKDTVINDNASFNALHIKKETQILGATTSPVSLPIANLPSTPSFQPGTEDRIFDGDSNTLSAGNFRNITLNKDSTLTLTGGTYNIAKLDLRESSTLFFATTTTLNIQEEFKTQQNVAVLPGAQIIPDNFIINYKGTKGKQKGQGTAPIHFGNNSFLNFILVAPNATVNIGERSTIRGQILADKIMVGKNSILSREEFFEKESDPTKVVEDENGIQFIGNELVVLFEDTATLANAQTVADLVDGIITGFVPVPPLAKIEVNTNTAAALNDAVDIIKNSGNPLIIEVIPNIVGDPII